MNAPHKLELEKAKRDSSKLFKIAGRSSASNRDEEVTGKVQNLAAVTDALQFNWPKLDWT